MMVPVGKAGGGRTGLVGAALLAAVFVGTAVLAAVGSDDPAGRGRRRPAFPDTFFATRRVGAEIVEVDSATGRVVRTIVDLGDPEAVGSTGGLIDGIELAADRRSLWFSRYSGEPGVVYRVGLPDGSPERVADGHGASVSADGRRLALIRRSDLVIRDLATGSEHMFPGLVGDLGGIQTAWGSDSRRLAAEISGADVTIVEIVDSETGEAQALAPAGESAINYRVITPQYESSHGQLSVVCCHTGEVIEGQVPHMNLVLHDPTTGSENSRIKLPAPAVDTDWDSTGTHLLFTDSDRAHFFSAGQFGDIPGLNDIQAVAW
jgi:hypothetical protein